MHSCWICYERVSWCLDFITEKYWTGKSQLLIVKHMFLKSYLTICNENKPLAIASGLSIGKEGPSVHTAVCIGNVISRMFGKFKRNKGIYTTTK